MLSSEELTNQIIAKQEAEMRRLEQECIKNYGYNVTLEEPPPVYNKTSGWFCPPIWDSINCWPETAANSTTFIPCPSYIMGFIPANRAYKTCTENGTWFVNQDTRKHWTDYGNCFEGPEATVYLKPNGSDVSEFQKEWIPVIKLISETGYGVSLISLIIAFSIMFFKKKLHCPRNILHMHLFASFILRAFLTLMKSFLFIQGTGLASDINKMNGTEYFHMNIKTHNWECKFLMTLWQYFLTANYSWILMEGLYLHNLIFRALFADANRRIIHYVILGWGLPVLVIVPWVLVRLYVDDSLCWTSYRHKKISLILFVPIVISIMINFVLFTRISLILYSKLRSPLTEDNRRYFRWAKSTLVLLPLFGVPYLIFLGMSSIRDDVVHVIWLTCDQLFGSFQGFFVAVLYCFLNGEVKSELKPHIQYMLTKIDENKVFRFCFPCRDTYMRSVGGRTSVCTTMSCSSLYTNGVLNKPMKSKFDGYNKHRLSTSLDKSREYMCPFGGNSCQDLSSKRGSRSHSRYSQTGFGRQSHYVNFPVETSICPEYHRQKSQSDPHITEDSMRMLL